jgi:hypothetical protein
MTADRRLRDTKSASSSASSNHVGVGAGVVGVGAGVVGVGAGVVGVGAGVVGVGGRVVGVGDGGGGGDLEAGGLGRGCLETGDGLTGDSAEGGEIVPTGRMAGGLRDADGWY